MGDAFGNSVIQYLPSKAASQCKSQFKSLADALPTGNQAQLAANLLATPSILNLNLN